MEPPRLIAWRSSDRHFLLLAAILVAVLAALVTLLYVVRDVRKIDGRPMTEPEDSVYVLGDNRPVSLDSRYLGFIPLSSIAGEAVAVIFPPGRLGGIDE